MKNINIFSVGRLGRASGMSWSWLFFLVFFAGGLVSLMGGSSQAYAQSTDDYCQEGNGQVIAFLVDTSSSYNKRDQETLLAGFVTLIDSLGGGERLIIKDVGLYQNASRVLFNRCYPACPKNPGLFSACNTRVINRERTAFASDIRAILDASVLPPKGQAGGGGLPGSSIVQSIKEIVDQTKSLHGRLDSMIVFSDFIEYRTGENAINFYSAKQKEASQYLEKVKRDGFVPDLAGTRFVGFGMGRCLGKCLGVNTLSTIQQQTISAFWNRYLQEARARDPIVGLDFPRN